MSEKQTLSAKLAPHGQEHLLQFWESLAPHEQTALARQIHNIDHGLVGKLFRDQKASQDWESLAKKAESPPAIRLGEAESNRFSPAEARQRGRAALAAGEVGVILVAGGQGTRLGFDQPKGLFPIGPLSEATLFSYLFGKVAAVARRYGRRVPIYLMTSPATHEETVAYLDSARNLELPREDIVVFCQGTMPAVCAATGKMLLAEKHELFLSPDGHGGMLAALKSSGALADIERRGIKHLFYCQVDNPLVVMCDAEFIGYHLLSNSEVSTQVVTKRTPRDKVGNVVTIDGRLQIIEYSDLNPLHDDIVTRKQADGSLLFWAGNTAVHVFDVAFLRRMAASAGGLPFHIAKKAVPHVNEHGEKVMPDKPNAIKFERFIFDLLPSARQGIVVEVDEQEVFAPVKNAPGEARDTPDTVKAQMVKLHRGWIEAAGGKVAGDARVEILPSYALDAEEFAEKMPAGLTVTEDRLFA